MNKKMKINSCQTSSKLDLVNETPKEHRKRKYREQNKLQRNNESVDKRSERLEATKLYGRQKRDIENVSDKSNLLEKMRAAPNNKREIESPEERSLRLDNKKVTDRNKIEM